MSLRPENTIDWVRYKLLFTAMGFQMTIFQSKLQSNILTLLITSIIIPVGIISGYSVVSSTKTIEAVVREEMERDSATVVNFYLDSLAIDLKLLSKMPPVQGIVRARENDGIDPFDRSTYGEWKERLESIFTVFIDSHPAYYQLRYLDENGQEMVRVDNRQGQPTIISTSELQDKSTSEYFQDAIDLPPGEIYVSRINLNRERGKIEKPYKLVIRYATPVYNSSGQSKGIIVSNIAIKSGLEIGQNNQELLREFLVVNSQGDYLLHPDTSRELAFELGHDRTLHKDYPEAVVEKILTQSSGFIEEDIPFLIYYQRVLPDPRNPESAFTLIYQIPKSVVFAPVRRLVFLTVAVVVLTSILMIPIVVWVLHRVIASVLMLTQKVSHFSEGLTATLDKQNQLASQQSVAVHQTTTTMAQLSQSSHQSAMQAESALEKARQAILRLNAGTGAMDRSLEALEELNSTVETTASQIQSLYDKAAQISTVSTIVGDLAGQTNMLALNAAIEAVQAGQQGKGFGVVATEIRKLADESKKSGKNIYALVEDIQNSVKRTVSSITEGTQNVTASTNIARETADIFSEVTNAIQIVVENSQQIALNSNEQALAIEDVSKIMTTLNEGARANVQSIQKTKIDAQQLNEANIELTEGI